MLTYYNIVAVIFNYRELRTKVCGATLMTLQQCYVFSIRCLTIYNLFFIIFK